MELVTTVAQEEAWAQFDETLELAIKLGTNPKRGDHAVRGAAVLPHGTGKSVRVCVFADGEAADQARAAGAKRYYAVISLLIATHTCLYRDTVMLSVCVFANGEAADQVRAAGAEEQHDMMWLGLYYTLECTAIILMWLGLYCSLMCTAMVSYSQGVCFADGEAAEQALAAGAEERCA